MEDKETKEYLRGSSSEKECVCAGSQRCQRQIVSAPCRLSSVHVSVGLTTHTYSPPPFISDTFPALHFLSPHLDNFPLCFLFSPAFVKKSLWWNAWSLPDNCLSSSHWNITPVFSPVLFVCVCDGVWLWSYMRQTIMAVNLMCSKTPFSRIKSHHRDSVSP